ncbi:MAG: 1-(5-phosphoribosyl)-5-[(5-phosphoribosylamino)methylideneamino] imidazole-4-carboxamide isomerase [Bryobacterales bacterium]|nr:1-(5-phosphoribosyl)-5-[(5-phosphoribosylamino)methylideneamino] imidazole-4-carboxamide isomerase [Bryobacterales bacterium]MDE0264262.1 1-(5-phosphoribosyl)-5-[(5-phosphoribosylamino)methylideneamino] imidazole-4-carboxamide isomerase [Bryobacterales bacterium]MDE0620370.1 1-(5-phosphoribosyl)-5-[(5-phosphoribosylamino)methylideneamino] imidazole-4-carboxamide isomerase [Bryobacterales bacterium]
MIIPCIDLMDGKVVQLVRGREKALEGESPDTMLERFSAFPVIQVIDLDQAIGQGSNLPVVRRIAGRARTWVGGGVRTLERAEDLVRSGAERVIVGTAAFSDNGPNSDFLEALAQNIGRERLIVSLDSMSGRIVIRGWRESTALRAEEVISRFEPYCGAFLCTYVDKEGTMQGTDLDWYRRLRAATDHEITAAGGIASIAEIRTLVDIGVHAALGMAVYTGHLKLDELAELQRLSTGSAIR